MFFRRDFFIIVDFSVSVVDQHRSSPDTNAPTKGSAPHKPNPYS